MNKRNLILLIVFAVVAAGLDQLTKYWAVRFLSSTEPFRVLDKALPNFLMLILQRNPDGVFGIAFGRGWSYLVFPFVALLIFLMSARTLPNAGFAVSYGIILGGSVGNTIDRIIRPEGVVDFISFLFFHFKVGNRWFGWPRWPTFNIADTCLVVGILLLLLLETIRAVRERRNRTAPVATGTGQPQAPGPTAS